MKRFHPMKTTWGFAKLLPLATFENPFNGYLVDDTCVFGAEIFVINQTSNWESISFSKSPNIYNATFTWQIEKFSELNEDPYQSQVFTVEGKNWYI